MLQVILIKGWLGRVIDMLNLWDLLIPLVAAGPLSSFIIFPGQNEFVVVEGLSSDMAQKEAAKSISCSPVFDPRKLQNCSEDIKMPFYNPTN